MSKDQLSKKSKEIKAITIAIDEKGVNLFPVRNFNKEILQKIDEYKVIDLKQEEINVIIKEMAENVKNVENANLIAYTVIRLMQQMQQATENTGEPDAKEKETK